MAKMSLVFFALIFIVVVGVPGVFPDCSEMTAAGLMDSWFIMPRKWFVPMADDVSQTDLFGVSPKSMGDGGANSICFSAKVKASGTPLSAPIGYVCKYGSKVNTQVCRKSDSNSFDKTFFQNWPQQLSVKIVGTDNSTFALAAGCFGGQLTTWALMSTSAEPSAEAKKMTEMMFPMKEGKAAAATTFKFESTEIVECGKDSFALNAASLGGFSKGKK